MSFEELRVAAARGNTSVMRRLRTLMQEDADHYRQLGDIGGRAILKWLDVHYRQDLYRRECLRMHVESKRNEHLEEGNSAIERLLIEEILLCWLRHNYWAQNEPNSIQNGLNPQALKFSIEQTRESQRMYLKAPGKLQGYRNAKARLPSLANQDETESA